MSDDLFDARARHQWETDGGRPCADNDMPDDPPLPQGLDIPPRFPTGTVAPGVPPCLPS